MHSEEKKREVVCKLLCLKQSCRRMDPITSISKDMKGSDIAIFCGNSAENRLNCFDR